MRVVVVGAGLSGLAAARELVNDDHDVIVVDKGRSVGGRLATRRIGEATLDHGAQFFTVRTSRFQSQVDEWIGRSIARVWSHGFGPQRDGHPRYIGTSGMNSLAKDLASGLDCRLETMAFAIRPGPIGWRVGIDDGTAFDADAVILTCPLPQAYSLTVEAGVELPETAVRGGYERTLTLLAVLDGPSAVPDPGGVQLDPSDNQVFGFIADNQMKGVSSIPAITAHAGAEWSEAHWENDPEQVRVALEERVRPWLGSARIVESQAKRWRFATPRTIWPDPTWLDASGTLAVCGDAFDGPRVEGAFLSGRAAAAAIDSGLGR